MIAGPASAGAARPMVEGPPERVPRTRSLQRGGMLFGATQIVAMALGFASSMLLVRVAEKPSVASYVLLLKAIGAVALVLQLGLAPAVLRFAPLSRGIGGPEAMRILRRRVFGMQAAGWLVFGPILLFAWGPLARTLGAPELATAGPLLLLASIAISFNQVSDAHLRAGRLYGTSAVLSQLVVRVLVIAGFLGLLGLGVSASWSTLGAVYTAAQLAATVAFLAYLARVRRLDGVGERRAEPPPPIGTLLSTVGVMGAHKGLAAVLVSWDLWILAWARPHDEVAVYGMMLTLLQVMAVIPNIANLLIPQEFAVLHSEGRLAELERLVRSSATAVSALSLAVVLALVVVGRPLIALAFGPDYVAGWSILLILLIGRFWDAAAGTAGFLLQMTGHHAALLATTAVATVVNVAGSVLLAPRWGATGVALATTGSLLLLNVILVVLARRKVGVRSFLFLRPRAWMELARRTLPGRLR